MNTVQKNNNINKKQVQEILEDNQKKLKLSDEDIINIARKINNMPRKALGYKTPLEVFKSNLKKKGIFRHIQNRKSKYIAHS